MNFYTMHKKEVDSSNLVAYSLAKLSTYEWVRYNMYVEEDIYHRVPGFYFRFRNAGDLYHELIECIDAFQGNLQWKLYPGLETRNQNYTLEPLEAYQARLTDQYKQNLDLKEILDGKYNEICEKAIKNIPALSNHIEKWFHVEDKMPILPDQD